MARPDRLIVVVGTGTGVGKTWTAQSFLRACRAGGATVAARKPVQSFDPKRHEATDAEELAAATGEHCDAVCPPHRTLPIPLAPPMATDALGLPRVHLAELLAEITWPDGIDIGVVETVGGVRSPIADDGDSLDLTRLLAPDLVVLVAGAALGTINDVRLATAVLAPLPTVVVLNRFDPSDDVHDRNANWLATRDVLRVVTVGSNGWEHEVLEDSAGAQQTIRESPW